MSSDRRPGRASQALVSRRHIDFCRVAGAICAVR
ncbi:putative leader peptide [Streptodolium elevatio]|uniref:Leader peptide n=1 Tax=Streptodolium elevatio TaxID=3157996 RepID=A0ABV3DF21_9ACTN